MILGWGRVTGQYLKEMAQDGTRDFNGQPQEGKARAGLKWNGRPERHRAI